jgi:hypothetical protein
MEDIRRIGTRRQAVVHALLDASGGRDLPPDWVALLQSCLPFLFPVAGSEALLAQARDRLVAEGVTADLYCVDLARDMFAPHYQTMLLLPCHHEIGASHLRLITSILREVKT